MTHTTTRLAPEHFEQIYQDAHGQADRVPWSRGRPSPALVNWLNAVAPTIVRCGARVAVVGCGLGDDARELMRRGYEVTAFDCAPSAVTWARRLDPENADRYVVADLFALPARWNHRFDLVVEINTIQAISPGEREKTLGSIASLIAPRGHLLVIARHAHEPVDIESGPPWPLMTEDLLHGAELAGLVATGSVTVFLDEETPPVRRLRALFHRAGA